MDGWMDGWTDGWMDRPMDRWTDKRTKSKSEKDDNLQFLPILKLNVFTVLLAISKRFELQMPDCVHLVDFLM